MATNKLRVHFSDGDDDKEGAMKRESNANNIKRHHPIDRQQSTIRLDVASFAAENYHPSHFIRTSLSPDTPQAISTALFSLRAANEKSIAELQRAVYRNHGQFLRISEGIEGFERAVGDLGNCEFELKSASEAIKQCTLNTAIINYPSKNGDDNEDAPSIHPESDQILAMIEKKTIGYEKALSKKGDGGGVERHLLMTSDHVYIDGEQCSLTLFTDVIMTFTPLPSKDDSEERGRGMANTLQQYTQKMKQAITLDRIDHVHVLTGENSNCMSLEIMGGKRVIVRFEAALNKHNDDDDGGGGGEIESDRGRGKSVASAAADLWCKRIKKAVEEYANSTDGRGAFPNKMAALSGENDGGSSSRGGSNVSFISSPSSEAFMTADDGCGWDALDTLIEKCAYTEAATLYTNQINSKPNAPSHAPLPRPPALERKLKESIDKMANYLYWEIADLVIPKEKLISLCKCLTLIGRQEECKDRLLMCKTQLIRVKARNCKGIVRGGSLVGFIRDLSFCCHSVIVETLQVYRSAFDDAFASAKFVQWAREELSAFADTATNQIAVAIEDAGDNKDDLIMIINALLATKQHSYMLAECGVDLSDWFGGIVMQPFIDGFVRDWTRRTVSEPVNEALRVDSFAITNDDDDWCVSDSCRVLIRKVCGALGGFKALFKEFPVSASNREAFLNIIQSYTEQLSRKLQEQHDLDSKQPKSSYSNILTNASVLVHQFLPQLEEELGRGAGSVNVSKSTKFDEFIGEQNELVMQMFESVAKADADKCLNIQKYKESIKLDPTSNNQPSATIISMLSNISKISRDITASEQRGIRLQSIIKIILKAIQRLLEGEDGMIEAMERKKIMVDLKFMEIVCGKWWGEVNTIFAGQLFDGDKGNYNVDDAQATSFEFYL